MKNLLALLLISFTFNATLVAEKMEMTDTDGKAYAVTGTESELKIEGMEGKIVLLEFFGLNCPACKQEMPHLINLQKNYPNKLRVMAIEVQKHEIDPINAYKKEHGINYTTFSNYDVGLVVRFVADKSGWNGAIPFIVAIDTKGKVQFVQTGVMEEKELEEYIKKFSE